MSTNTEALIAELREIHQRSRENAAAKGWGVPPADEDHSPWSRAADTIEALEAELADLDRIRAWREEAIAKVRGAEQERDAAQRKLDALKGIKHHVFTTEQFAVRDRRVAAEAVRAARDSITPAHNMELRYDGTEDPQAALYVEVMHEAHDRLTEYAERIENGETDAE